MTTTDSFIIDYFSEALLPVLSGPSEPPPPQAARQGSSFEQHLVSSSRPPGAASVLSVVTSAALCKTAMPLSLRLHLSQLGPVCLLVPATVTAAPMLDYTRLTAAVSGCFFVFFSKPWWKRSRFILNRLL